ncbi:hypothetical protein ACTVZO_20450 [Streptomyces sp. IBSNAI002]|uniref:hypothetical protein n=1 Tax=Streptomyces sp. IBSNAI002 TaxID=3457500 RepID=UPI003FD34F3E
MPAAPCQLEPPHPPPPPQEDDDDPQEEDEPQEDDDPLLPPPAHQLLLLLLVPEPEPEPDPEYPFWNERAATVAMKATKAKTIKPITMKTNTMSAPSLTPRSSRGTGSPRPV